MTNKQTDYQATKLKPLQPTSHIQTVRLLNKQKDQQIGTARQIQNVTIGTLHRLTNIQTEHQAPKPKEQKLINHIFVV